MAAAYSTDDDGTVRLPFDVRSGRMIPEVWERWLACDPVRMVPGHADALRSLRAIYIDAGTRDEWFLELGAVGLLRPDETLTVECTIGKPYATAAFAVPTMLLINNFRSIDAIEFTCTG